MWALTSYSTLKNHQIPECRGNPAGKQNKTKVLVVWNWINSNYLEEKLTFQ